MDEFIVYLLVAVPLMVAMIGGGALLLQWRSNQAIQASVDMVSSIDRIGPFFGSVHVAGSETVVTAPLGNAGSHNIAARTVGGIGSASIGAGQGTYNVAIQSIPAGWGIARETPDVPKAEREGSR